MFAYRIADPRYPIFDPTGALLHGGRWNSPGRRVIYAAETYAGALLEVLVHSSRNRIPRTQQVVRIEIPSSVKVETVLPEQIPGWDDQEGISSRAFGDAWFDAKRTAILRVPSVLTQGRESNLVINAEHSQFALLKPGLPEPIVWDLRLFQ